MDKFTPTLLIVEGRKPTIFSLMHSKLCIITPMASKVYVILLNYVTLARVCDNTKSV